MRGTVSPEILCELLKYDPETGVFLWRWRSPHYFPNARSHASWNARFAEKPAFTSVSTTHGYTQTNILGRVHRGHRVAWAMHFGRWPEGEIDHINGDRTDNRISNLRDVGRADNGRNLCVSRRNKSGVVGVTWDQQRERWFASIRHGGKTIGLGRFDSLDAAAAARRRAEQNFGFHQNHGRKAI